MKRRPTFGVLVVFALVSTTLTLGLVGPSRAATSTTYGPDDASYAAYYGDPSNQATWMPFCNGAGDGATYSGYEVLGVPACGPTPSNGTVQIDIGPGSPLGGPSGPGFQCVEFAERYLWVHSALAPLNSTNGGALVNNYATKYGLTVVKNGAHEAPPVGAVMSFASNSSFSAPDSDPGHVAVVSADTVNASTGNGKITIIGENQNTSPGGYTDGEATMTVNNWQITSFDSHTHIEWVVAPIHAPAWLPGSLIDPPGATAVQFDRMACPTKGTCVVIGSYNDAKSHIQGMIETLSDGKWRETGAPAPVKTAANSTGLLLTGVSCASATYCVAVGAFGEPSAGLVEILSGSPSTWKPKPYEVGGPLSAVACGAVGACVALNDIDGTGAGNVIETLSGGEWKPTQATSPRSVQPADVRLDAVTCLDSHFCAAAGYVILPNENETQGLVETFSGSSWVPFVATQQADVPLTSVACATSSLCAADGVTTDSSSANSLGGWGNVLATFSTGHLSDEMAPLPRGSTYKQHPFDDPTVACPPGGPCTAALEYYDSHGARQVLVETLSAGGWAPTQAPIPFPADEAGSSWPSIVAGSAACAASTYCALVGIYELGINGTAINAGFIDVWSQGHWATIEVQQDSALGYLNMVSCPTVGWCVAVGPTGFVEQAPGD
jgi:hypothetical protein